MLIPPCVLMIVWGILTEQSIGELFLAGILPGFLLTAFYVLYILVAAMLKSARRGRRTAAGQPTAARGERRLAARLLSTLLVIALVAGHARRHLARRVHAHRRRGRGRGSLAAARARQGHAR